MATGTGLANHDRLTHYLALIRFDRPIGWLLLLWPTWIALLLAAKGLPPLKDWLIFTLGVFLTRSAGCIVNDYADRWLDPQVERTRLRPMATGAVGPREALGLFCVIMGVAGVLVMQTNATTVLWAVVAMAVMVLYPYAKRSFPIPQLVLGVAFGLGIPMAYTAQDVPLDPAVLLLFLANLCWTLAYDTIYAMVDRDDDRKAGARSSAIFFGRFDLWALSILHALSVLFMTCLGLYAELGAPYFIAVALLAGAGAWLIASVRGRDRAACFQAFRRQHWLGATWFIGTLAGLFV